MKNLIGQLMSVVVIQFLISSAVIAHGVEFSSAQWWYSVLIGGLIFNVGLGLRGS